MQSWSIRRFLNGLTAMIVMCCSGVGAMALVEMRSAKEAQASVNTQLAAKTDVDRLALLAVDLRGNLTAAEFVPNAAETLGPRIQAAIDEAVEIQKRQQAADLPEPQQAAVDRIIEAVTAYVTWSKDRFEAADRAQQAELSAQLKTLTEEQVAAVEAGQEITDAAVTVQVGAVRDAMNRLIVVMAVLIGGTGVVMLLLINLAGRYLIRHINHLADGLRQMAAGDLTVRVDSSGKDEVSQIGISVNQVAEHIAEVLTSVNTVAGELASSASTLQEVAVDVTRNADQACCQAGVVARAADEVSQNVQSVAAGSEQMGASISEIARNANEAAAVASGAVQAAESTTTRMAKLGESSREIGDVIRLITSIAEQTNLLALNATIEAARAGDAGKGFAVVADEVKQLAQETARATEDISRRVETIQTDADEAGQSIGEIAGVIFRINEFQTTIASAVEEQSTTSQEINHGVSDAAASSGRIADSIAGIASAAEQTAASMGQAQANAQELSRLSDELLRGLSGFRLS